MPQGFRGVILNTETGEVMLRGDTGHAGILSGREMEVLSSSPASEWEGLKKETPRKHRLQGVFCGEGGIRTPGTSRYNGFQDRRNRPLCHLSSAMFGFVPDCVAKVMQKLKCATTMITKIKRLNFYLFTVFSK